MPLKHFLLALAVVGIWGTNFVVIKGGLDHLPPLLFATLRFTLAVFPAIFFVKRPPIHVGQLAAYGLFGCAGQFGLLYLAIKAQFPPGLASLVVQSQVFFTVGLAMWISRERLKPYQCLALVVATAGLLVVAGHLDGAITLPGLLLVLGAALSWACANMLSKQVGSINMLAYVVWSSAFAIPLLFALSLATEGWAAMRAGVANADLGTWAVVAWQSWANTLFGFAAWTWLLARHPAAMVVPTALLVPVFGLGSAALWLGEPFPLWKATAFVLVLGGLAINMLWPHVQAARARQTAS